jgi:hypothetical protein
MFPECRLFHEELNACYRITEIQTSVIIVTKVVGIGQTIATQATACPVVHAHCAGDLMRPVETSIGQTEVDDGCHRRVLENSIHNNPAKVVLETPVRQRILLQARK